MNWYLSFLGLIAALVFTAFSLSSAPSSSSSASSFSSSYSSSSTMPGFFETIKTVGKFALSKSRYDTASAWKPEMGSLYEIPVKDIDGQAFDLGKLRGKVALVCNVASECGYTKCGYSFLQEEQLKYQDRNFTVIGTPCNQFGGQEPGSASDIKEFAQGSFKATFPLLEKMEVNGPNTHPMWKYLKAVYPGDVTWNFHGFFVINEEGIPIARFNKEPYPEIDARIKKALDDRDAHAATTAAPAAASESS